MRAVGPPITAEYTRACAHCSGDRIPGLTLDGFVLKAPTPLSKIVSKPRFLYPVIFAMSAKLWGSSFAKPYFLLNLFLYVKTIIP